MGPVHNNFKSWWQPHMLIIGQPHKMLRDVRSNRGSRELSSTLMEILSSGENHNVSNLVFSLVFRYSNVTASLLPSQNFLQRPFVSGENRNVLYLVFHSVCQSAWPSFQIQQCHCFIALQPKLLTEATITCRHVIPLCNAEFRQSVPSKTCSPSPTAL